MAHIAAIPAFGDPCETAISGNKEVQGTWFPASQVRAFTFNDPAIIWLERFGMIHGFEPDSSEYDFFNFIVRKSAEFEMEWSRQAGGAVPRVCGESFEVRSPSTVRRTFDLMKASTAIISQPGLWWAPERIYGVPDLVVHSRWLRAKFPSLISEADSRIPAPHLGGGEGHYIVLDIKFTTRLDEKSKAQDLANYSAQVRLYSFMLGQLQGFVPTHAFLVARDRVNNPLPVAIGKVVGQPLDPDLASMRDSYADIMTNGTGYLPWKNPQVIYNLSNDDEKWHSAKKRIARDCFAGGDPELIVQIGPGIKSQLATLGFTSIASLLGNDPATIPLESCKGLGPAKSKQVRAVLTANRNAAAVIPDAGILPSKRTFEFFVDYEFLTNLNVDFAQQWPTLEGHEMIFMVGVGWEEAGAWNFKSFSANQETSAGEYELFENVMKWFMDKTAGKLNDPDVVAMYHWSTAEVSQSTRAADRLGLAANHPVRQLPWCDLQKVFLNGPCCLPGMYSFGLKETAQALSQLNQTYATEWPGDLDSGLRAMVMGWKAYEAGEPNTSKEMKLLEQYLEADCKAVRNILSWLRI